MIFLAVVVVVVLAVCLFIFALAASPLLLPLALVATTTAAPAGVVPAPAAMPIFGPIQGEDTVLMQAIQPWYGMRYVLGGNGPPPRAVDCSGFTLAIASSLGFALPRTAQLQFNVTQRITDPQPRDLVFFHSTYDTGRNDFITHVGVYIGDGMMVSAIQPFLGRQSLGDPYWRQHFAGFGRLRRP